MILTVTLNTALDKVLIIKEWISGSTMRTPHILTSVGGKGMDSSVVLRHLGVDTVGMGFVAGKSGDEADGGRQGTGALRFVWSGLLFETVGMKGYAGGLGASASNASISG